MTIPSLTPEKRKEALEKAQVMRKERAALRVKMKTGEITLKQALNSTNEVITKMRVSYLLESLPHIGKITAAKIMADIGISANRRVQGLGGRQKEALLQKIK
ncbi:MAG: integration host factor, actinobacterial type [Firmicutes bacterium]|nr:integration host factor, actinobacterial type [Bacillota bacterium]MDD4694663.1 integration host factor, actinobacterial type [Bacillota bacterium]